LGTAIAKIIHHLRERDVSRVRAAYFIQWRLIFESDEAVIASSTGLVPEMSVYPEYDDLVEGAERIGLVFHRESHDLVMFDRTRASRYLERATIDDFVVFTPGRDLGPGAPAP
jgi:hypothetical protein